MWILLCVCGLFLSAVQAESFDGRAHFDTRSFEVPDEAQLRQLQTHEIPNMAEYNYDQKVSDIMVSSGVDHRNFLMWTFLRESTVTGGMTTVCRQCMIAGNLDCVLTFCQVHADVTAASMRSREIPVEQNRDISAFATGTSMYSDILCSLCKQRHDVTCTLKLCVDPERTQNAADSGVQCRDGFCRWQKEAVHTTGFNNYYHAWWQPQNLYFFFDHVTTEIASAYNDFLSGTSEAISRLG